MIMTYDNDNELQTHTKQSGTREILLLALYLINQIINDSHTYLRESYIF